MLENLPVVRSAPARALFLASAIVTVATLVWSHHLKLSGAMHGLTPIYYFLFTSLDYPAAAVALLILVIAALVPGGTGLRSILRWTGEHPFGIAVVCTLAMCLGAVTVYHNHPLSMDEYAPYFQSQAFAAGHLAGQFPAPLLDWLVPPYFQDYFLFVSPVTGQVASTYWPSFALLLAPFTFLGIPWACNPLISGLTLLAIHRLALAVFADRESAGMAVLLTAASPVFFANGISYYSMPAHLLANTVYALLLVQPTARKALLAGVVGSVALTLHNPVPHILFALPWLIWMAARTGGLKQLGWLIAGYLPLCLLLGLGWFWFTTDLQQSGLNAGAMAEVHAAGLQRIAGAFSMPSWSLLLARLISLAKVWLWAVPGLLILAGIGARRWRRNPVCRLLLYSALTTFAGYLLVPADQGHGWGYRYFHSAWLALPILATAAFASEPAGRLDAPNTRSNAGAGSSASGVWTTGLDATRSFVTVCALLTLVIGVGFRARQMNGFIGKDLQQVPAYLGTEPRVVIINVDDSFYGVDLVQNDPWLRGGVIRMISHDTAADAQMMGQYFPTLHQVFTDASGSVWSAGPVKPGAIAGTSAPAAGAR